MLPSPSSSPPPVLVDRTNIRPGNEPTPLPFAIVTPPLDRKRPPTCQDGRDSKRVKLEFRREFDEDLSAESDDDLDLEAAAVVRSRTRRRTAFSMRVTAMMGASSGLQRSSTLPTRPILQSLVSSHKADVFKCQSVLETAFMSVPYTCEYSHDAKRGRVPLLAVATEQGTVQILDTSKRRDWDSEPQRTILHVHANGIFDVKWSPSDTLLATASGDQTTCITSLESSVSSENRILHVLHGHESTVKCVAWDPSRNGDILCTGGRDGRICIWDLRVGEGRGREMDGRRGNSGIGEAGAVTPVMVIPWAHEADGKPPKKPKGRKGKTVPAGSLRSITSVLHLESDPYCLVSSNSLDGILRQWDIRLPTGSGRMTIKAAKAALKPIHVSQMDPTTLQGTRRSRGITSLAAGHGPSVGYLFALGTDSRVHTYTLPSLEPLSGYKTCTSAEDDPWMHTHDRMQTNSFYVRLAVSPCGQWLASGSAADGRVFLFDVSSTVSSGRVRLGGYESGGAVELCGQTGEVGAIDWAEGMLATCADDATVRIWRPDVETYRRCIRDSEEMKWGWSWAADKP